MATIHPADPETRRKAFAGVLIVLVIGLIVLVWVQANIADLGEALLANGAWLQANTLAVGSLLVLIFSPVLALAASLFLQAQAARREERWPASTARLIKDTRVVIGTSALWRATLLQILALALVMAVGVVVVLLLQILQMLVSGQVT